VPVGYAHLGHPVLVGLGLSVLSSAIMIWRGWTNDRVKVVRFGIVVGVLAGLAVAVVAFFFVAGLRCTD
jgi:hypothetical protein